MIIRKYGSGIPDRIPIHADDVNVGSYLIYVNRNDIACFDEAGFYPINAATLENLYVKGVLISENGVLYAPLSKTLSETDVELAFLAYDVAKSEVVYRVASSSEAPAIPFLASLTLGTSVLTPSFDPDVFVYTAPTTETSDVLTLTALPPEAVLEVKLGENVVSDYDDTGIVWGEGENVVTITVGDELVPVVYTITVTKS